MDLREEDKLDQGVHEILEEYSLINLTIYHWIIWDKEKSLGMKKISS